MDLAVVILAGGTGTRFWPLSTAARPKQFLRLLGERSLLEESYARATLLTSPERILVLTNECFVPQVLEQLPDLPAENLVGEPLRRDTAAAIALAALLLEERMGDPVMVTLTADHRIEPAEAFREAMLSAARAAAREPVLYTFGITPTYAATAYGYLQLAEQVGTEAGLEHRRLVQFREKPDASTAQVFLESGDFFWNSGMFVWQVQAILAELERQLPEHLSQLRPAVSLTGGPGGGQALSEAFANLEPISIDRGVMEKAEQVRAIVAPFSWSDLGGWLALEEFLRADGQGNRHRGVTALLDATGNLVFNEDLDEVVALVGVRDLVVVRAGPRTLIVDRSRCEDVKQLVQELEDEGLGRHL